jgi:hypothetical protein
LCHFIFNLGSEFDTIQNNFHIRNLPPHWNTQDWPTLLILCRDYFDSVKPQGVFKREQPNDTNFDRASQHKKVKEWFMNPSKFRCKIEAEQHKHLGKCIFHLTKSHSTDECNVKKECNKLLFDRKNGTSSSSQNTGSTGQLHNVKGEIFEDAVSDNVVDDCVDESTNDTNEDELLYFTCVTNHYLHLVKASTSGYPSSCHAVKYPIIVDSGANYHMFKEKEFFESLYPASGRVIPGDGKTILDIEGIGTVKCKLGEHILKIENVRYIPDLAESIYSLFLHIQSPSHGLKSSFAEGMFIIFPTFQTKAILGADDIYLDAAPANSTVIDNHTPDSKVYSKIDSSDTMDIFCRNIKHFQSEIEHETKHIDNLLSSLQKCYKEIKTKRQLNLDVTAGFRQPNKLQQNFRAFTPPRKSSNTNEASSLDTSTEPCSPDSSINDVPSMILKEVCSSEINPISSSTFESIHTPLIRSVDKPSSSLPTTITMSEDLLRASVGFRRVYTLKRHFQTLYQDNVKLYSTPVDAVLDSGNLATMKKKDRNTTPVPRSLQFADIMHMDIVFGPDIAIGNVHYGFLFTDRFSRMTYLYPLQNLTSDIKKQMEAFFAHIGCVLHHE